MRNGKRENFSGQAGGQALISLTQSTVEAALPQRAKRHDRLPSFPPQQPGKVRGKLQAQIRKHTDKSRGRIRMEYRERGDSVPAYMGGGPLTGSREGKAGRNVRSANQTRIKCRFGRPAGKKEHARKRKRRTGSCRK